ncbi:hypothetical protein Asera_38440 [Actinocatenispora sera]|uniref:UspA domain-containing protein n=2 Tax=Actinocatenispora sera TaxID=390989 RepID=A0A810L5T1_9ACTN|nr:hypothetical protein Asera_38440 [Actinocatenispora sera]
MHTGAVGTRAASAGSLVASPAGADRPFSDNLHQARTGRHRQSSGPDPRHSAKRVVDMTVGSEGRHDTAAPTGTPTRIMVGVDGSSAGQAALLAAQAEAAATGLHVLAVHVRRGLTPLEALGSGFAGLAGACWLNCRDDAELSAWLDCVQMLDAAGLPWTFLVREGQPAEQLRAVAAELPVRSIYLAARSRPWWRRGLHHCPARALSRRARCPVRVVSYSGG